MTVLIYALQDLDHDATSGVFSLPARFGGGCAPQRGGQGQAFGQRLCETFVCLFGRDHAIDAVAHHREFAGGVEGLSAID